MHGRGFFARASDGGYKTCAVTPTWVFAGYRTIRFITVQLQIMFALTFYSTATTVVDVLKQITFTIWDAAMHFFRLVAVKSMGTIGMATKTTRHWTNVYTVHFGPFVAPRTKQTVFGGLGTSFFQFFVLCFGQRNSTVRFTHQHIVPMVGI